MHNRVQLIGHLGADPEIRHTQSGAKVASFRVATSESWKDKATGEKKERTDWHTVVCFNDGLVGVIERYLAKGSKVMVEGKMQTRSYQDKDGHERWTTEVVLNYDAKLLMLDKAESNRPPPADSADGYGQTRARDSAGTTTAHSGSRPGQVMDDDIPF